MRAEARCFVLRWQGRILGGLRRFVKAFLLFFKCIHRNVQDPRLTFRASSYDSTKSTEDGLGTIKQGLRVFIIRPSSCMNAQRDIDVYTCHHTASTDRDECNVSTAKILLKSRSRDVHPVLSTSGHTSSIGRNMAGHHRPVPHFKVQDSRGDDQSLWEHDQEPARDCTAWLQCRLTDYPFRNQARRG